MLLVESPNQATRGVVAEAFDHTIALASRNAAVVFQRLKAGEPAFQFDQRFHPLAEHNRLFAARCNFIKLCKEVIGFGTFIGGGIKVANLFETGDGREHLVRGAEDRPKSASADHPSR